jgi:hypothetical protein
MARPPFSFPKDLWRLAPENANALHPSSDRLLAFHRGALPAADAGSIAAHLALCAGCAQDLVQLVQVVEFVD